MNEQERVTPLNLPQPETSVDRDRTLPPPTFDENSIHRARPAVPLTHPAGRAREGWSLPLVALAIAAGMLGGIVGIFGINAYQRRVASQSTAQSTNAPRTSDKLATAPTSATTQNDAGARANSAATSIPTAPATRDDQTASVRTATTGANAGGGNGQTSATQAHVDNPEKQQQGAGEDGARELRAALGEWITATNARDIDRQMNFYEPRVAAFYLTRNVSREAVRAEKSNVFARASAVDVRADDPQITLSPDGRTATMRFRKEYSIEGGGQDRRGAVIQELRWRRTPAGWKITSERDLRIVN